MRIPDDPFDAVEARQLFGSALGVTAGDEDASAAICGVNVADGIASLSVGGCGHGACIEYDDIGIAMGWGAREATIEELMFDGRRVRMSGATPEIFDGESGHGKSRRARRRKNIIAEG